MPDHHNHERRFGRVIPLSQLSCAWYSVCGENKPLLTYEMEKRFCIKCNAQHWFFVKKIEFEQPEFNPNDHWISDLYEMGYFDQFDDADGE